MVLELMIFGFIFFFGEAHQKLFFGLFRLEEFLGGGTVVVVGVELVYCALLELRDLEHQADFLAHLVRQFLSVPALSDRFVVVERVVVVLEPSEKQEGCGDPFD